MLYLMNQKRVLSCFDTKRGYLSKKKNDFFENMSLLCLVFNKYVFILFLDLFELVPKLYYVKNYP